MMTPTTTTAPSNFLLPLSAVPETLPVLFGRDGDFEGAPNFHPPLWGVLESDRGGVIPAFHAEWHWLMDAPHFRLAEIQGASLDLRVPSVAARMAGLCARATRMDQPNEIDLCWEVFSQAADGRLLPETAARLGRLFLSLAPRIAALGGNNGSP